MKYFTLHYVVSASFPFSWAQPLGHICPSIRTSKMFLVLLLCLFLIVLLFSLRILLQVVTAVSNSISYYFLQFFLVIVSISQTIPSIGNLYLDSSVDVLHAPQSAWLLYSQHIKYFFVSIFYSVFLAYSVNSGYALAFSNLIVKVNHNHHNQQ